MYGKSAVAVTMHLAVWREIFGPVFHGFSAEIDPLYGSRDT